MALKIARGLFRLWLVASVLWVVAVGAVTWSRLPTLIPVDYDPFVNAGAPGRGLSDEEVGLARPKEFSYEEAAGLPPAPGRGASPAIYRPPTAWMRNGALMGILPPALVLLVGSALGWAFRGFRA
jgi:hypothetical protein